VSRRRRRGGRCRDARSSGGRRRSGVRSVGRPPPRLACRYRPPAPRPPHARLASDVAARRPLCAGLLSASSPCAPLPSTVRALAYSPRGEALAAGSMHSGVFLWLPPPPPPEPSPPAIASTSFSPAAAAAPPPPPSLRLPCTDEIVSLSLSSASSGALWCAARSAGLLTATAHRRRRRSLRGSPAGEPLPLRAVGRLARVWLAAPAPRCSSLAADAADPPRTRDAGTRDAGPPMTFGGLSVAGAHGECHLSLHAGGRAGESRQIGSPELLVLADGARGASSEAPLAASETLL